MRICSSSTTRAGSMSGWDYFRKQAEPGENPEIFTDPESKIQKYQRVLRFLFFFIPILFMLFAVGWNDLAERGWIGSVLIFIVTGILFLYLIAMLGILRRIGELKKTFRG
jgi:hypothetical protein